jgi:hypothetical protein
MRFLALLIALILSATAAQAQLLGGDALIVSNTGLTHIRGSAAVAVTPVAGDGFAISSASFGNGAIETILGTDLAIYAEGAGSFGVYLLDFAASLTNPTSTRLGLANAAVTGLAHDAVSDSVFGVSTNGEIFRIAGPLGPSATVSIFATGQAGATALVTPGAGRLLAGDQTQVWEVNLGDSSPNAPLLTLNAVGLSDLAYDPGDDRLYVAAFGASRVEVFRLETGEFLGSVLTPPSLSICDAVDYDPRDDRVYALSRLAPTLGGSLWGNQVSFDNVLVCVAADGSAPPQGCSPQSGHGNTGLNAAMAIVRSPVVRLDLDPTSVNTVFDSGMGTVTASGIVAGIRGTVALDDPTLDALVGATVTFDANFSGTDLQTLGDISFSLVDLRVFQSSLPPASADIEVTTSLSANTGQIEFFGGPSGARAFANRRFELVMPSQTTNLGASSLLTQRLADAIPGGRVTLDFDTETAQLSNIGLNLNAQPGDFDVRLGTTGLGDLELGTLRAPAFARLFHLATPIISSPTGAGPFLGLAADQALFDQLFSPFGTAPFHVLADGNGLYRFNLPAGFAPSGTAVDYLGIAWDEIAGTVEFSRPRTIVF